MDAEKLSKMTDEQLLATEKATRYMIGKHPYRVCLVYQHVRVAIYNELKKRGLK